jgi:hypothetical protein
LVDKRQDVVSRGYGLNRAAEESAYDNLLFLDTDMLISESFIGNCAFVLNNDFVYFPVCWSLSHQDADLSKEVLGKSDLYKDKSVYGNKSGWRTTGYGMSCMQKRVWENAEKIPNYWEWGKEDSDFYKSIKSIGYGIIRQRDCGLVHQWHPK